MPSRKSPVWRWATGSVVAATLAWVWYLTLARPIAAEPEHGRVWALPAHGPPVYITTLEMIAVWAIPLGGFGVIFLAWRLFARD